MSLEFWIMLWKIVFIVGISMFAVLAVVVSIGGARDIVKLLNTLKAQQAEGRDHQANKDPSHPG